MNIEAREHIREWWGKKPLSQIAADVSLTKQRVSQLGKVMNLEGLSRGASPGPLSGECAKCGAAIQRKPRQKMPKLCPKCHARPGNGEKAYHLRRVYRRPWLDVADKLGYRSHDAFRGIRLLNLARSHALAHGLKWPLRAGEAAPD